MVRAFNVNRLGLLAAAGTALLAFPVLGSVVTFSFSTETPGDAIERTVDGGTNWYSTSVGYFNCTRSGGDFAGRLVGSVTDPNRFVAFCIEPREFISANTTYTYTVNPLASGTTNIGGMGAVKAQRLNYLYGRFFPDFSAAITVEQAAALQVATWEIVREPVANPLDVYSGQVMFRNESRTGTLALAQSYLTAVSAAGDHPLPLYGTLAITQDGAQDLVVEAVPEPAVTLLACAISVPALARRRRKPAANA